MKQWLPFIICSCLLHYPAYTKNKEQDTPNAFHLTSPSFAHNGKIPQKFTCDGQNISPKLHWINAPALTKSFAMIVDDPDAPTTKPWVHWILFNIDPSLDTLEEGVNTQTFNKGLNDFGNKNYGGPCPPSSTHHYSFKLYALDKKIALDDGTTKQQLIDAMHGHILAQTELVGLYKRKRGGQLTSHNKD